LVLGRPGLETMADEVISGCEVRQEEVVFKNVVKMEQRE